MHLIPYFLMALMFSAQAQALSLGELNVQSAFAAPLEANIEIPVYTAAELDDLTVRLAPPEVFKKAGLDITGIHRELTFKVQQHELDGRPVVRITTNRPVKELGLSFFIEARWRGGNLVRAYDVLLTPSIGNAPNLAAEQSAAIPEGAIDARQVPAPSDVSNISTGLNYGPVRKGEILGVVARKMVPSRKFSLQQVMVGIFDQNPHAFSDGNINQLEPGVTLRLQSPQSVTARTKGEAIRLIQQHTRNWNNGGASQVKSDERVASTKAETEVSSLLKIEEIDESSLQILAPGSLEGEKDGRIMPTEITALRQELTVTLQEAEALKKQNEVLKDKVTELEKMVALRLAQLMPEKMSAIEIEGKTSIIDKSEKVFKDDLVSSSSDISLREDEQEYFTEIMGLVLLLLGGGLIYVLYRQKQQKNMFGEMIEQGSFWEQLRSVFKKKDKKITLRI